MSHSRFRAHLARPIALVSTAATLALLSGCSSATDDDAATDGVWSYTDDLGVTVTLDHTPERIAGLNDVLISLVNYGIDPVASFGYTSIDAETRWDGLDTDGIVEVGTTYGEIDLEELAAQAPDLIVAHQYPTDSEGTLDPSEALYGFADLEQQEAVEKIAPIVTIAMAGSAVDVMKSTERLAVALGVSDESGVLPEAKAEFDEASATLSEAAESGVTVVAIAAYETDGIYAARAADDPALRMYTELGVQYAELAGEEYYWSTYSWENIASVSTDVWLYSQRAMGPDELQAQPTFAATPGAAAEQILPWEFQGMDYASQADYMNDLAGYLTESDVVS